MFALLLFGRLVAAQQTPTTSLSTTVAKLSPDLAALLSSPNSGEPLTVIVSTTGRQSAALLAPIRPLDDGSAQAPRCQPLDQVGTYLLSVSKNELLALLANPDVLHVSPNRALQSCQDYATTSVGAKYMSSLLGISGAGVTVAVLDTGIATHRDLTDTASRIVGWVDLVNGRKIPYDDNGHGTHVAGIVAGNGAAAQDGGYSTTLAWMAPAANLVGVKVLDKSGGGTVSSVIAGINWCIDNRQQYNIRVLNLSLGHCVAESFRTDPLCQACERAWNAGIVVVCAAGNMGRLVPDDPMSGPAYGSILCPGNDPMVITVGATNTQGTPDLGDDVVASYSSRGPSAVDFILKPDIVAPGNRIESLGTPNSYLFQSYPQNGINPMVYRGRGPIQYFRMSGTSMASPVVAGAAALLLQVDPSLTPDTIKARLLVSATKSTANDPFTFGAGYLNVPGALLSRIGAPMGAASPVTYPLTDGTVQILTPVDSENLIWGNNLIWGDNKTASVAIYGTFNWGAGAIAASGIWSGDAMSADGYSGPVLESILLGGD